MPFETNPISSKKAQETDFLRNVDNTIKSLQTIKNDLCSLGDPDPSVAIFIKNKCILIDEKIKFYQDLQKQAALPQNWISKKINLKNSTKKELKSFINLMESSSFQDDSFVLKQLHALFVEQISTILDANTNGEFLDAEIVIPAAWETELTKLINLSRHPASVVKSGAIQDNGKILNDDTIKKIQSHFQKNPNEKILTGPPLIENDIASRIIKINSKLVALYEPNGSNLGVGATGTTVLAQDIATGQWFALKEQIFSEPKKNIDTDSQLADSLREAISLQSEKELLGVTSLSRAHPNDPDDMQEISVYTLMELAHGTDLAKAKENGNISEKNLSVFAMSAANSINNLHQHNRLHRDIKLENIVWDPESQSAKLVDFGSSISLKHKNQIIYSKDKIGTQEYLAPESAKNDKNGNRQYSKKSDTFSLGIVFAEMLYKGTDYGQVRNSKDPNATFDWKSFLNKTALAKLSPQEAVIFKLAQRMTVEDPYKRISMEEVVESLNLANNYQTLEEKIEAELLNAVKELPILPNTQEKKAKKIITATLTTLMQNKDSDLDPISKAMLFSQTIKQHDMALKELKSPGISKIFKKVMKLINGFLNQNQAKLSIQAANSILENKLLHAYANHGSSAPKQDPEHPHANQRSLKNTSQVN